MDEPRSIAPLERELLVVDDDRVHQEWRAASARSAARCPLTTALSIVAGRPVSIQSPARNRPGTAVRVDGRGGCPGATENVALFSRTTTARRTVAARAAGSAARISVSARSMIS